MGEGGEIVIPDEARELFDIRPGDTLFLLGNRKKGIVILPRSVSLERYLRILTADNGVLWD